MYNVKYCNFILHKFTKIIHIHKSEKMKRVTKEFQFPFPLNHKIVRDLRLVNEHVGDLVVEGSASFNPSVSPLSHLDERYEVDIDFIRWNGTDIKPVLELTGLADDIQDAALRYCASLFTAQMNRAA